MLVDLCTPCFKHPCVPAHLEALAPIVLSVILSEVFVDCVKHAFITKFNDISPDVYRKYRQILSEDMTVSRSSKVSEKIYFGCSFVVYVSSGYQRTL